MDQPPFSLETNAMDLKISRTLSIPSSELKWNFSRSSGPGGQHVNTTDSRVELSWSVFDSRALSAWQRQRLIDKLGGRLNRGVLTIASSQERSQWRNRIDAQERLVGILQAAFAPDSPERKQTKPTRGSVKRRLTSKANRSSTKALRRRPPMD